MSKPAHISLETRASVAFVQGRMAAVAETHAACLWYCACADYMIEIFKDWMHAQAELKALHAKESK